MNLVLPSRVSLGMSNASTSGASPNPTSVVSGSPHYLFPIQACPILHRFLGAIGHTDVKPGILEVGILLKTRFALDQHLNLRPVKLYPNVETPLKDKGPEHIDFVVVRENSGGIYTGIGGVTQKGTPLEVATQVMQYSYPVVRRVGSRRASIGAYHRGKAWEPS